MKLPTKAVWVDPETKKLNVNIWPKQKQFIDSDEIDEILMGGAVGGGKILALNGVILTPFGFKKCSDLKVGDAVNNPDGTVAKIVQLHPIRRLKKWTVYFHDGTKTDVAKDHLWLAWKAGIGKKVSNQRTFGEKSARIVETQDLKDWLNKKQKPLIPVCTEQHFNIAYRNPSQIDPYLLGLLLGDGSIGHGSRGGWVTITSSDHEHFKAALVNYEYSLYRLQYRFKRDSFQKLRTQLTNLKLWGTYSHTKFVPRQFLYSSLDVRYALIQGLLDTDGTVDMRGQVYYTTTSKQLSEDMKFLIQSVGGTATIFKKTPFCKVRGKRKECRTAYTLYIKHRKESSLFRLLRKKQRCKDTDWMFRRVIRIEDKGEIVGRCITVSHPNGLYLTNDFIVTHNSFAILLFCLKRRTQFPGSRGIVFRRHYPDLKRTLIAKAHDFFLKVGAKYNQTDHTWKFKNGSVQEFGALETDADVFKYHSAEYDDLCFDEATTFTQFQFEYMTSRCRTSLPGVKALIRLTSNPGNIGHLWVKQRFIDPARVHSKWYLESEKKTLSFIPARLEDNPSLRLNDPTYEDRLKILGDKKYRALRFGDWEVFEGQFFNEWSQNHILPYNRVPDTHSRKFLAFDWGYHSPACVLWFEITTSGRIFAYRELYVTRLSPKELAEAICNCSPKEERYQALWGPPEIWGKEVELEGGGQPIQKLMQTVFNRVRPDIMMQKANNARVPGWTKVREFLRNAPDGMPWLQVSPCCENLLRTLPMMIHDEHKVEDLNTEAEDHAVDAARYGLVSLNTIPKSSILTPFGVQAIDRVFGDEREFEPISRPVAVPGRGGY